MRILKQGLGVLATGYILLFYSESLFWARIRPEDSLSEWLGTWTVYSVLAYILLSLCVRFRVSSIWALFLVGTGFGWLTEGIIVQTAYESLPLSLSFTGLAWHALITVGIGLHTMAKALHSGLRSVLLALVIGLGYGFWAIAWWVEPDGGIATPLEFATFAFTTTLLLIAAYWIYEHTIPQFTPSHVADWICGVVLLFYFIFVTIPAVGSVALILPLFMFGLWLTLRHNRQVGGRGNVLEYVPAAKSAWVYWSLMLLPVTATLWYTVAFRLELRWHTNRVIYLLTTPLGFIMLAISCVKVWTAK